jgi:hypothetical protein
MFDVDGFIADCRRAAAVSGSPGVLEAVARAVATPAEVLRALGEPQRAAVTSPLANAEPPRGDLSQPVLAARDSNPRV